MRRAALAGAGLLCGACVAFGITTTVQPESTEGPIPTRFQSDEPPALAASDVEGLFRAPSLGPNVYFHEPPNLWYRRAYRRWYQAFRWNGNWFILAETPEILVGRKIEKVELPELPDLPDLPDDDPRELPGLPELPDDEPDGGFEPP